MTKLPGIDNDKVIQSMPNMIAEDGGLFKPTFRIVIIIILIIAIIFSSCKTQMVDEYKVTRGGMLVYNTHKYNGVTKDIMLNGDTLITTRDTIYVKHVFHPVPLNKIKPIPIY